MQPDPDKFDWVNDEDIIIRRQEAVAVYENTAGEVVIRREARDYEDEDACVILAPHHVPAVIQAMLKVARVERPALPAPSPDPTGAVRQKRYRERHRNGVT